jgi:DNA (cytosine-5)-methyltransferase 1
MINDLDNTKDTINHLSLCTGYEGVGIGLRRVLPNLREIAYVEREGYATALLAKKMETGELASAPIHTDVKTFPYRRFLGQVDILSAGFPCQPFSSAGGRQSTEDPRHLFPFILEGIKQCRPELVFLENVEGIISSKTGDGESVLKYVLRSLEEVDYTATAGVFSASEVNAPHQRKRVFILAYSNSCRSWKDWKNSIWSEGIEQSSTSDWGSDNQTKDEQEPKGREDELAYSNEWNVETRRRRPRTICPEGQGQRSSSDVTLSSETVANSESKGLQGRLINSAIEKEEPRTGNTRTESTNAWPSRPNERQYSWEAPRVINTKSPPQPKLGRATNGSKFRLDRLRILGNGVVPATAEKAFRVLANRLMK